MSADICFGVGWGLLMRVVLMGFRYYEGGVSSVYFWDLDDGFAGVVLLKKSMRFSFQLLWFSVQRSGTVLMGGLQQRQRARVKAAGTRSMSLRPSTERGRHTTSLRVR